jgi:hypothetical protein
MKGEPELRESENIVLRRVFGFKGLKLKKLGIIS